MNFPQLTSYFEGQLGFTTDLWVALLGAHSMGGAHPDNTQQARNWTSTPWEFGNGFFRNLADDSLEWIREPAGPAGSTDPNVPLNSQFQLSNETLHHGLMMLPSDMEAGWCLSTGDGSICPPTVPANCPVSHGLTPDFCPPRTQTFGPFIQLYGTDESAFFTAFIKAFTQLSELTNDFLAVPINV